MLLGALIGRELDSLWLIALLGIGSHFLLDMIPHWDVKYDRKKLQEKGEIDIEKKFIYFNFLLGIIGLIMVIILSRHNKEAHMLFGALIAYSPDFLSLFYAKCKNKWITKYVKFHSKIQGENSYFLGTIIQTSLIIVLVKILF